MKLTDAEWRIMDALWDHHPATARELAELMDDEVDWAYTTLKTMLSRLAGKGAVSERKQGKVSLYTPLVSRRQARNSALRSLAEVAFRGAFGPLLHFLVEEQKLSEPQREELLKALREREEDTNGDD